MNINLYFYIFNILLCFEKDIICFWGNFIIKLYIYLLKIFRIIKKSFIYNSQKIENNIKIISDIVPNILI